MTLGFNTVLHVYYLQGESDFEEAISHLNQPKRKLKKVYDMGDEDTEMDIREVSMYLNS